MFPKQGDWYVEYADPHLGCFYKIDRYLYSGRTRYQQVQIVETKSFGLALILDGKIQSAALDENVYHEALVHPAMVLNPEIKNILVIGGGEGAVLRETLRYPHIEKITMVDIDEQVVKICREHLKQWHQGSFDDARVELLFMDARRYLEETENSFDLIISDLSEPAMDGPSYLLFTLQFYEIIKKRLSPGGILVLQAGGLRFDDMDIHAALRNTIGLCFPILRSYYTYIPSFDSPWGFIMAGDTHDPLGLNAGEVDRRLAPFAEQLKFYNGETHEGIFKIPKNIRKNLLKNKTVIKDDSPFEVYR